MGNEKTWFEGFMDDLRSDFETRIETAKNNYHQALDALLADICDPTGSNSACPNNYGYFGIAVGNLIRKAESIATYHLQYERYVKYWADRKLAGLKEVEDQLAGTHGAFGGRSDTAGFNLHPIAVSYMSGQVGVTTGLGHLQFFAPQDWNTGYSGQNSASWFPDDNTGQGPVYPTLLGRSRRKTKPSEEGGYHQDESTTGQRFHLRPLLIFHFTTDEI